MLRISFTATTITLAVVMPPSFPTSRGEHAFFFPSEIADEGRDNYCGKKRDSVDQSRLLFFLMREKGALTLPLPPRFSFFFFKLAAALERAKEDTDSFASSVGITEVDTFLGG